MRENNGLSEAIDSFSNLSVDEQYGLFKNLLSNKKENRKSGLDIKHIVLGVINAGCNGNFTPEEYDGLPKEAKRKFYNLEVLVHSLMKMLSDERRQQSSTPIAHEEQLETRREKVARQSRSWREKSGGESGAGRAQPPEKDFPLKGDEG